MLTRHDIDADQRQAIDFIRSGEDSLLCADVGTGKTVIALTAGQDAIYAGDVHRWLVLAPKLVGTDTWAYECDEWEHLQDMDVAVAIGTPAQRKKAIESTAPFVVTNYENLPWLMAEYPRIKKQDTLPFDGLICDELDKLKSVSSNRFKDFRNRLGKFHKRVGLTGTLVPNSLTEIWGQSFMVDGGDTFAKCKIPASGQLVARSFYKWRQAFFYPIDFNQHNWVPFPDTEDRLLELLDGLVYRLPAKGLPPVITQKPFDLELPSTAGKLYKELEREFYAIVKDCEGQHREVEAVNTAVLRGKLQQITAGFSYVDRSKEAVWHSQQKFGWLRDTFDRLSRQLLVVYQYQAELDELKHRYPGLDYLGAGVSDTDKSRAIRAWNAGDIPLLAIHAQSAGHGLNLQKSGAHDIAYLTLPWSGGMFKQVSGRLARRGQSAEQVNVWTALCENTIDHDVFATVTGKLDTMQSFQDKLYDRQCRAAN